MTQRVSPWSAGLRCRCPKCGRGRLFKGYLTVAESCEACGADFSKADSGDGPAVFIIFILGAIVVPLAMWFENLVTPPLWVHVVVWGIVIMGGTVALLRPFKGVMIALQFHHQASDSGRVDYDN